MNTKTLAKRNTKTLAKRNTNEHKYMCDNCGDRADVRTFGKLVCSICYLLQVTPHKVDKLRRKII